MDEAGGVRVGDGVGNLDRDLHGAADVHRPARRFGPQRLALQELEREVDAAVVLADVESVVTFGCDRLVRPRACVDERGAVRGEIRGQQPDRDRASELGVARAIQIAGTGRLELLEQVVVGDDTERARARRGS